MMLYLFIVFCTYSKQLIFCYWDNYVLLFASYHKNIFIQWNSKIYNTDIEIQNVGKRLGDGHEKDLENLKLVNVKVVISVIFCIRMTKSMNILDL